MEDKRIVELFWQRSETAISETDKKYRRYCHAVAHGILDSNEDSEECVNDTFMRAWNTIPPKRPDRLSAFLARIVRNLAFDKYRERYAKKRGRGNIEYILDELQGCIPSFDPNVDMTDDILLRDALNSFLRSLAEDNMQIFMHRYWYGGTVRQIAEKHGLSENSVKVRLHRMRDQLKAHLEKEGIKV